jgi:hypothetical protein
MVKINIQMATLITEANAGRVTSYLRKSNEVGFCTITKEDTPCITLYMDPEYKEYTTSLIAAACSLLRTYFNSSQKIYVDADASEGLWDKMGFQPNPLYDYTSEQRSMEGAGYEKYITFSELCSEVLI